MNIDKLIETIIMSYEIKRPVLALSSPGVGKSSAVYQAAALLSEKYKTTFSVIEIRGATLSPVETEDIKYVDEGVVKNATQDWFPTEEKVARGECPERGIIFADELADGTLTAQSALQRLLLDRRLGSLTLAEGWHVVGASNRASDKAAAGRISTASINRVIIARVEPDTDTFIKWGIQNGLNFTVIAFCRWRKGSVWNFDPAAKNENPAFCSPRSMHILSDILNAVPAPDYEWITGTIGDGVGSEFFGFLRIKDELPDLDKIERDPDSVEVPKSVDVAIATMYALTSRLNDKNSLNILKYLKRNKIELATMAFKDLCGMHPKLLISPVIKEWMCDPENYRLLSYGY